MATKTTTKVTKSAPSKVPTATTTSSEPTELWTRYRITMAVERLHGGIPASEKTMSAWLDAKAAKVTVPSQGVPTGVASTPQAVAADQAAMLSRADTEELRSTIFYRDLDGNPCYEGRCFKAALKEAANILKEMLGKKAWRSKIAERVFVEEKLVLINRPLSVDERVVHAMTMQGPRTSLKRFEVAENVTLTFTLRVLNDGVVTEKDLRTMLEYLQDNGIGSDRSQGAGTFALREFQQL